jgi:hypothetical protein
MKQNNVEITGSEEKGYPVYVGPADYIEVTKEELLDIAECISQMKMKGQL